MNLPTHLTALALSFSLLSPAHATPCSPADLNADGLVDFADYLEFLNLYDAQDPRVDFNQDGLIDFADYLEFLNLYEAGCLPTCTTTSLELAAVPLAIYPYANFVQTYLDGTSVSIAIDPFKSPDLTGKTTRIYITTNRTWAPGDALTDVRGAFQTITWPGTSTAASTFTLTNSSALPADAGEDIGIPYDLIIDENNNGLFDACDLVDGPGPEAGFYKFRDLTTANAATPITQIDTVSIPIGRVAAGYEGERWYFPADIASRGLLPLIFISHGNGHLYTWYDHLGQHLATYGYIVITHDNNTSPGTGVPSASTSQLDHLNTLFALQSTLAGGVLNGHLDQNRIYTIGHSRGGEAVAYSYDRLGKGLYTPTGGFPLVISQSNIKYIQSIAPVDFAGPGDAVTAGTNPGPADFMLLYGSADGDVCGCPGSVITWSFSVYERAAARRNSVYIQGVGHNEFNCCGFFDARGPDLIGRFEAQQIQKAVTLASIKHWRENNIPCGEVLWRQYESFKPGATLPTAVVDLEFKDAPPRKFVIDDFQTNPATSISSSGALVTFSVTNLTEGIMRDNGGFYTWSPADPFNGMSRGRLDVDTQAGIVFDYDNTLPSRDLTWRIAPAGRDTTPYTFISFRACQGSDHPFTTAAAGDQVLSVELLDSAGRTSRVRIDAYGGGLEETYRRPTSALMPDITSWQNEFETIRIPLTAFTTDGRTLDRANITVVRLLVGSAHGTEQGRIALDDLEFVK